MNALELIPSVFFDAIARVVPGITAIAAYLLLSGHSWSQILEKTLGPPFATALWPATGLLFLSAYIVGQLIAPFAKLAQRIGEWEQLVASLAKFAQRIGKWKPLAKLAQRIGKWKPLKNFGKRLLELKLMPDAHPNAYDFLRLYYKDAGQQCAKIRAEFTMYNGFATVFLACTICYPVYISTWRRSILVMLVGATVVTAYRGRTTRDTYNSTVMKFAENANFPNPPHNLKRDAARGCDFIL